MKLAIPALSNLFAVWASAGQYSSVEQLELAEFAESPSVDRQMRKSPTKRSAGSPSPARKRFG